ncbi:MAG TPA: FAD-dependent oxidoreductase [Gammaproteobacteria bacterium]
MSGVRPIDYLIVGQGLAGSLLAWALLERGQQVVVVDDSHRTSSSIAAAGLINPITGQRLAKGPEVEACLATARACYRGLEQRFGQPLLHEVAMQRLVTDAKLRDSYEKRCSDPAYADYLGELYGAGQSGWRLNDPFGSFRQHHTGYLAVGTLLALVREALLRRDAYVNDPLPHAALSLAEGAVMWGEWQARRVIFCEGYLLRDNPWFNWLPLQPAKGEILTIDGYGELPEVIINGGHWLLPLADGHHKLGASYDRDHLDETLTVEARRALLGALSELIIEPPTCRVIDHRAGVRPGTRDKQPFLGLHPHHPQLAIFNGFGSRGSLLIPWHAELFADVLCDKAQLPAHLDIRRHWSEA